MKTYEVEVPFSGYCRGYAIFHVKADSEEQARELVSETGELAGEEIVRDDRDMEWSETGQVTEFVPL